jgi:bacterioferritin-associated ferredoxin
MIGAVLVCHCHAVNDRAIRQAVREGACSYRQVALACKAGRRCGGCRPSVLQVMDEELASAATPELTPGAVAAS